MKIRDRMGNWLEKRPRTRVVYEVGNEISHNWWKHKNNSMAAAIAYRGLFSLVPILVLMMVVSRFLEGSVAIQELLDTYLPERYGLQIIEDLGQEMMATGSVGDVYEFNWLGLVIIGLVMLYGASTVFREVVLAMETIWETRKSAGMREVMSQRILAVLLVLGLMVALLAVALVNWLVVTIQGLLVEVVPVLSQVTSLVTFFVFPLLVFLILVMLYKYMPQTKVAWGDVWVSGLITSVLFLIGQAVIAWSLSLTNYSTYMGTAGSFILFMIWVYYSAMIFLFGAELTRVYAYRFGSRTK